MLPEQSYVAWKVCLTLLHAFAVGSTGLRLWDRFRNRKLWWDDYVALLPMVCDAFYGALFFIRFKSRVLTPEERHEISQWTVANSFLYYTIIWTSRISLSLSITRIFAPGRVRNGLFGLTSSFVAAYVVSFVLSVVTCSAGTIDWRKLQFDTRTCRKGPGGFYLGGMIATTFDFIADAALVICPLVLLWRVHLPEVERRMVLAAFSASILTALSATIFCIFWYGGLPLGPDQAILFAAVGHIQASAFILHSRFPYIRWSNDEQTHTNADCIPVLPQQTAISLIVCNTLIVSMYFYRRFRPRDTTHASPAISTFSDDSQCTHVSVSERRQRRDAQHHNRPYATAPPRLTQSPSEGVSYDLPERFAPVSERGASPPWGDDESEYPESTISSKYQDFGDVPSWLVKGGEQLSITSTFESAAKRAEEKEAKKARKAWLRGKPPNGGKKDPRDPLS